MKGQTPVVATSGQRQSINVISAVNVRGEFWAATHPGKLNAAAFVEFLKNFRQGRGGRKILVIDGHPAHKAKLVEHSVFFCADSVCYAKDWSVEKIPPRHRNRVCGS